LQKEELIYSKWVAGFFRIGLSHNNLINMIKTNFAMIQHHQWSLTEIEEMMPWERDVYVTLLNEHVKEENERIQHEQSQIKRR